MADYNSAYTGEEIDAAVKAVADAAPKDSPALTGIPTAPTATAGTNTTQIATTAFVQNTVGSSGGGDMLTAVYDPSGRAEDIFAYADSLVRSAYDAASSGGYMGTENEFYTDLAAMDGLAAELAAI